MPRRNIAVERTATDIVDTIRDSGRGQTPALKLTRLMKRRTAQPAVLQAGGARARRLHPEMDEAITKLLQGIELNEAQERAPLAQVAVTPSRNQSVRIAIRDKRVRPFGGRRKESVDASA